MRSDPAWRVAERLKWRCWNRKQAAKGHLMLRSVDNPNEVFTRVEFDSIEDAKAFRDRLVASGALGRTTVLTQPTVVELVESITY